MTSTTEQTPAVSRVLFVCTGNQCRSPMAEALLRAKLAAACGIQVASAGTSGDGTTPPPEEAVRVMAGAGLDIDGRPSRPVDVAALEQADLVVVMARQHLVDVATQCPSVLDRSFTFTDLLERAARAGARGRAETLAQWARRMSAGRDRHSILTLPSSGDIDDPIGRPYRAFEECFAVLDRATTELAAYICPDGPTGRAGGAAAGPSRRRGLLSRLRAPGV